MKIFLMTILFTLSIYSKNEIGRVPGPYNNEFVELEVGPNDLLWAGTWGDGIKKSSDQAVTWSNSSNGLTNLYINDIKYKDGVLLAGTQGGGVFISIDEGANWVPSINGLTNLKVQGVAIKDDTTYFAATQGNGIFRTTDGGETWEEKNNGNNFQDMNFIHLTPAGNLLASRNGEGLIRSDDNGESWQYSQSGIFNKYMTDIQTLPNDEMWISSAGEGIFQSSDDGMHWLRVDRLKNIVDLNIESFTYFKFENEYYSIVGTRNWGVWRFDTQWNDPKFLWTTFQWRTAQAIVTLSSGRIVVAMGSDGLSYTDNDGSSWKHYRPYLENDTKGFKLEADGSKLYVAIDTIGIFKSEDYGNTWNSLGQQNIIFDNFKRFSNRLYYVEDNQITYSDNDGVSWNQLNLPDLEEDYWPDSTNKDYIAFYDILHKGTDIYISYLFAYSYKSDTNPPTTNWQPPAPKNTMFYSSNNGSSWSLIENIDNNSELLVGITTTTDNDLYVASQSGLVWKSTNKGANWIRTSDSVTNQGTRVEYLKAKGNGLFVGTDDSLMVTNNDGGAFNKVDWNAENISQIIGFTPIEKATGVGIVDNNTYYIGLTNSFGIYKTTDNGVSFDSINNSFPCEEIRSVTNNADGDVYFATTSIWRVMNPIKMPAPLLVSPPDKTTNLSIDLDNADGRPTAVIQWEEAEKADMYEIQVSEYEQFYNFMYKKVHAGTSATLTDSLKYNTTYYWRVRSKTNDSYSRWSSRWEFTTEMPAPKLTYPDNNDVGVALVPTYTWEEVPNSDYYVVQLASSTAFQDVIFSKTITSTTFSSGTYTPTVDEALMPSTSYYWRAKTVSSKSESDWSDYNMFTTVTGSPKLIYPENNSSQIPTEITFEFEGVPSAERYFIQVSSDSTFKDLALLVLNRETESDSTHFFDFLQFFRTYYWRVQSALIVEDGNGDEKIYRGEWSQVFKFTTGIKPPGLLSPPNNAFDVPLTAKLEWDDFEGAEGYHVQLSTDQTFETGLIINDTLPELTYDIPEGLLDNYSQYYWRMRVILADNAAAWVSPWRFTTIMEKSSQVYPPCEEEEVDLEFTIVWNEIEGADLYRIQVAKAPGFAESDMVFEEEDIDNDRTKIESGLEANKTYYWRIQGYNDVNIGPWSDICTFSTLALGIRDIAKEFNFVAYPNPTSDKMNYEFSLEKSSQVQIEIYDMSGLRVSELVNTYLAPGTHLLNWDVKGVANGTYNLVMTVKGQSYIKLIGVRK